MKKSSKPPTSIPSTSGTVAISTPKNHRFDRLKEGPNVGFIARDQRGPTVWDDATSGPRFGVFP
jgi:hypothetical protein